MKSLSAAAIIAASFAAQIASAATVTVANGSTVDCASGVVNDCNGIFGGSIIVSGNGNNTTLSGSAGSFGSTADLYDIGNGNNLQREADALNILTGEAFSSADAFKTDSGGVDDYIITGSVAEYIAFKAGNEYFFLQLLGDEAITLTFDKNGAQGGGLSHFTEFGERTIGAVPLPASSLLLMAGIGGLAAMRRRKG